MKFAIRIVAAVLLIHSSADATVRAEETIHDSSVEKTSFFQLTNASNAFKSCGPESDGTWFAYGEVTFFKYLRSDGIRVGTSNDESGEFNYSASPRITLGYYNPDGLSVRTRYWEYDDFAGVEDMNEGDGIGIETYTIDLELFDVIKLTPKLDAELSIGLRYNEFDEIMQDSPGMADEDIRRNAFKGFGMSLGAGLKWYTNQGNVFVRSRGVLMQGDKLVYNDDDAGGGVRSPLINESDNGVTPSVIELAIGYELEYELDNDSILFARVAYERQIWIDYTQALTNDLDFPFIFEQFSGPSNAGFGGVVMSFGFLF